MFAESEADGKPFTYVGQPAIVDGAPYKAPAAAPEIGQDNQALLAELGYGAPEIARLEADRVIAAPPAERHIISAIYGDD